MNKSQIISVQASAGSGKTYNLAKRYLYLLLDSGSHTSIKNVIAVTFTNKAAVEMKYRVMSYLKKAALSLDTGNFFDDLKLSKNEIADKSSVVLKEILESYDNFNISTIDSFKNHILKSCAISVDLSPNFTVERDYSGNLLFSLEIFLQKVQISENLRSIVLQYLSQYLMRDTGWFPKNNIYSEIEKVFKASGNTGKDVMSDEEISFRNEIDSRAAVIIEKIEEFAKFLPNIEAKRYYSDAVEKVLKSGRKIFFSMDIPARFAYETVEYTKGAKIDARSDELWNEINKEIRSLCDFYMENYYGIYSYIYSKVALEFDGQSKKDGVVFLNEINKKTVGLFEKNNTMPEVYCRLSEKYKHFLIDEFQDTSLVQWLGIKRFLEESLAEGGTFFYVGDVKQAIYAFRGGNSEIFDTVSKEFPSADVDKRYLKQNFRSGRTVVNFNNNIFSKENIERFLNEFYKGKDVECNFSKFIETYSFPKQETPEEHNYGYVEIDLIDKTCKDVEEEIKQRFINCIFQISERFKFGDIAVLCRTNDEILTISSWLLEKGLGVESSQTLNIRNNSVVKQIVSLLIFIDSPINALSFSSFVIGDVFGKAAGVESNELEKFIFIYNKGNKNGTFYKAFREVYKSLWNEYFEGFFVKAGFVPVYELILAVLEKFKIADNFPDSKAFIMCFLELIKDFETQDSGLKNFLEYFNNLKNNEESLYIKSVFRNSIKVMTVHKTKGLQFPAVVVPFLKLSEKAVGRPYFDDSGEKIKLLSISENLAKFSQKAKKIYDMEKMNSLLSELNTAYVSMTRAEYEFYAIVPPKSGNSNNAILLLLGNNNLISGTKRTYSFTEIEKDDVISDAFIGGYKDMQKYLERADRTLPDIKEAEKKGSIIHYALSKITSLKNKNISDAIDDVLKITKRKFFFEDVEFCREKLSKMFVSEEILNLFAYGENNIYNEKEVVDTAGKTFRIDKLIVRNDEVIIVDFKSSNSGKEKNEEQLRRYVSLVSEIYPNKKISAYIADIENAKCLPVQ
ncbi:UvrD-helicase domain-containing protein [Candidatus Endomicrobiellum agilis]|uniref:UvrD-helicase domain-containing protein n=1 Tax=Candidatus Endomicrobiellum agilis TaxID=3238957 RepID=UPI0035724755|nr:UvrD-helicase domain-containing protein [Endomicrobium sp.]